MSESAIPPPVHGAAAPGEHERENRGATSPCPYRVSAWFVISLLTLIVAGFLGLDGWAYAASLRYTNTPDELDRDFYRQTRSVWYVCRLPGHPIGAGLVYFIVLGLHRDGWRVANRGLVAVLTPVLSSWFVKMLVGRVRPNQAGSPLDFLPPGAGFESGAAISFPSGEATTAFALAAVLACIYPRWSLVFFAAAGLTGLARLVQGSHYVSDVAAGALAGSVLAAYAFGRLMQAGESWTMREGRGQASGPRRPRTW